MKEYYEELIEKSKEKIEFMEKLSHTTFVTGENKGQAIILVDHNQDEIEISLDDIQAALRNYYRLLIKSSTKILKECDD